MGDIFSFVGNACREDGVPFFRLTGPGYKFSTNDYKIIDDCTGIVSQNKLKNVKKKSVCKKKIQII